MKLISKDKVKEYRKNGIRVVRTKHRYYLLDTNKVKYYEGVKENAI